MKKPPLLVFIIGSCLSLIMLACGFLFLNAPECPTGYGERQIRETGCIMGANIGLGLGIFASIAIAVLTVVASLTTLLLPKLIRFDPRVGVTERLLLAIILAAMLTVVTAIVL